MQVNQLIDQIAKKILPIYKNKAQANTHAWWILQWLTGQSRTKLITKQEINLGLKQEKLLEDVIDQHVNKQEPIQYIFKKIPFLDLDLEVKSPILIPRPETEEWVADLINDLKKIRKQDFKILDLCTGTGCIGLSLAKAFKKSFVLATDISLGACQLAKKNAQINNIKNIKIVKSDLYSKIPKRGTPWGLGFDLIVSNPPYVSYKEWLKLDPMVKNWEDFDALVAKEHGLNIIKKIIKQAPQWLNYRPDFYNEFLPQLVIEIGYTQANSVKELLEKGARPAVNFVNIKIKKDLAGKDRLATAGLAG